MLCLGAFYRSVTAASRATIVRADLGTPRDACGVLPCKVVRLPMEDEHNGNDNERDPKDGQNILPTPHVLIGQDTYLWTRYGCAGSIGLVGRLNRYGFQVILCQNAPQPGHSARNGATLVLPALIL